MLNDMTKQESLEFSRLNAKFVENYIFFSFIFIIDVIWVIVMYLILTKIFYISVNSVVKYFLILLFVFMNILQRSRNNDKLQEESKERFNLELKVSKEVKLGVNIITVPILILLLMFFIYTIRNHDIFIKYKYINIPLNSSRSFIENNAGDGDISIIEEGSQVRSDIYFLKYNLFFRFSIIRYLTPKFLRKDYNALKLARENNCIILVYEDDTLFKKILKTEDNLLIYQVQEYRKDNCKDFEDELGLMKKKEKNN